MKSPNRSRRATGDKEGGSSNSGRRSVRLQSHDYSEPGTYFITICTAQRRRLFGNVRNGVMRLNGPGSIVAEEWLRTGSIRPNIELDEWVIMPDHFHAIVTLTDHQSIQDSDWSAFDLPPNMAWDKRDMVVDPVDASVMERPTGPPPDSLGRIVAGYKGCTTRRIRRECRGITGSVWQRSYWDHIIRDERSLESVRQYVRDNPARWDGDAL